MDSGESSAWHLDQVAKSEFFHARLHEWALLDVATAIEAVKGETLTWELPKLGISEDAWNKLIHRGIKPILIFAHPDILVGIPRSAGYYRMLAMVSQKSMGHVRVATGDFAEYELGTRRLSAVDAANVASHLNTIISLLLKADEQLDVREFDLWRGMAAGTQAQGSWQNLKGKKAEAAIKGILHNRLKEKGLIADEMLVNPPLTIIINLRDGRQVRFGDEPDIAVYGPTSSGKQESAILAVVEVKGGIDTAAVHERHGASLKSMTRAKSQNPKCITILALQAASLTSAARTELDSDHTIVNHWITSDDILSNESTQGWFFELLGF